MHYCLNKNELQQFVRIKLQVEKNGADSMFSLIDYADNWQDELCIHSYLLCCLLENLVAAGEDFQSIIDLIYSLPDNMFLKIQELDSNFVDFMLKNLRQRAQLSLEEEIVDLQNRFGAYQYEKNIRY